MSDRPPKTPEELPDSFLVCVYTYRWGLACLFALSCVAYGFQAFNVLLTGDDFPILYVPDAWKLLMVQVGRWGQSVVWELTFDNRFSPPFTTPALVLCLMSAAMLLAKPVGVRNGKQLILFAGLLTFCPIMAEHMVFKSNHLTIGIGLLSASMSLALTYRLLGRNDYPVPFRVFLGAAAVLCLVFAIGSQQSITLFAGAGIVAILINMFFVAEGRTAHADIRKAFLTYGGLCVVASVAYVALSYVIRVSFGLPEFAGAKYRLTVISSGSELVDSILRFMPYFKQFWLRDQYLWPLLAKYSFLLATTLWLFMLVREVRRKFPTQWLALASALALVGLFFLSPWIIVLVHPYPNSYHYSALLGLLPIYPVVFAQGVAFARREDVRRLFLALGWIVILNFVYYQSLASVTMFMVNRRDLAITERILARVESHPDYRDKIGSRNHAIVLVGILSDERSALPPFGVASSGPMDFGMAQGGVYDFKPNRFIWLVREVDYPYKGRVFRVLKENNLASTLDLNWFGMEHLRQFYEQAMVIHPWPAADSIMFVDNIIFVVLSKPPGLMHDIETILVGDVVGKVPLEAGK